MTLQEPTKQDPRNPARVKCERCGSLMRLTRTTPVSARGDCYEFWSARPADTHICGRRGQAEDGLAGIDVAVERAVAR